MRVQYDDTAYGLHDDTLNITTNDKLYLVHLILSYAADIFHLFFTIIKVELASFSDINIVQRLE